MFAPDVHSGGGVQRGHHHQDGYGEQLAKTLGQTITPKAADLDTLGLNHLSWHRGLRWMARNMWEQVLRGLHCELRKAQNRSIPRN